jgi:hypothetical protein
VFDGETIAQSYQKRNFDPLFNRSMLLLSLPTPQDREKFHKKMIDGNQVCIFNARLLSKGLFLTMKAIIVIYSEGAWFNSEHSPIL